MTTYIAHLSQPLCKARIKMLHVVERMLRYLFYRLSPGLTPSRKYRTKEKCIRFVVTAKVILKIRERLLCVM